MDAKRPLQVRQIFRTFVDHEVEFIVVGGVCAVLHGAPVSTFDLDIVHRRSTENLPRLEQALKSLDAHYRFHPKRISPTQSHLITAGHQLLMTNAGALDVLGTLIDEQGYEELLADTVSKTIELGMNVRLLTLDKLIEIKEKTARPKDLLMAMQLKEVREQRNRGDSSEPMK